MSEITYNVVTVTQDKNIVAICTVTVHDLKSDYDIIPRLRESAQRIRMRVRHDYKNLVYSPVITSRPEEFKWDESKGPYSQLR